jgi:hypothetical protein
VLNPRNGATLTILLNKHLGSIIAIKITEILPRKDRINHICVYVWTAIMSNCIKVFVYITVSPKRKQTRFGETLVLLFLWIYSYCLGCLRNNYS